MGWRKKSLGEIRQDRTRATVCRVTLSMDFVGVIPGSALENDVHMLLDAVVHLLSSPIDLPHIKGFVHDRDLIEIPPDDSG
jgi:translation elongation factor EF-G